MPTLSQTLHGYDQGHRLLASSGDLDERELALLERLSDLSGYLPTGTRFDSYLTGFPCGRFYALARTWLDTSATRAGTVLTHTLLLPLAEASALEDFWGLSQLHRRPQGAGDRKPYSEPLTCASLPEASEDSPSPDEALAAVVLLLGTEDRPILWVDERQPEVPVRFVWSLLRPEQRTRFAFCTFALQLRTVGRRPFDFLGLPPAARGSFLEQAGSDAWWDTGRLRHERTLGLARQPWAQSIAHGGAAELRRLEQFCQANGLQSPASKDIPVLRRFMDLEAAASERLPAARSRADLFERLWPELPPTHPAAAPILEALLDRQGDAALEPRPLWELTDFLKRPLVQGRRQADEAFALRVEKVLKTEVERRFYQVPSPTLEGLPELLDAAGAQTGGALLAVIRQVLSTTPDAAERLVPQLLQVAERRNWPELVQEGLSALSPPERRRALDAVPSMASRERLLQFVEDTAGRLDDFELLLLIGRLRGHELAVLDRRVQSLLAQGESALEKGLESLRAKVPPSLFLSWALETAEPNRLAWHAAEAGARAAQESRLGLEEFVRRCSGTPNGARLLLVLAERLPQKEPLERALRQSPALALDVLMRLLREEGNSRTSNLMRVALELISEDQLLAPELLQVLRASTEQWRTKEVLRRIGPQWLRAVYASTLADELLADWLYLPWLRQWLKDATRSEIRYEARTARADDLLPGLCRVLRHWLNTRESYDTQWVPVLLERLVEDATPENLNQASEDLSDILRRFLRTSSDERLATTILNATQRTRAASGWRFVEQLFPRVYANVLRVEPSFWGLLASAFTGKDWDRAKPLRKWLIHAYVSYRWPPESFLRCLHGDTELFFRLAYRAARTSEGMAFLRSLPAALEAEPELASRWRRPVEEALSTPNRVPDPD